MKLQSSRASWLKWWFAAYIVFIGSAIGAMIWARRTAFTELSTPTSISDWQAWKEDVRQQQAHPDTVERRVPKSDEPPALVLLRDYFNVLMFGAVLFSSMLYWIIAWFVTGILKSHPG